MTVSLRPMTDDEIDEWLDERSEEYIADRVAMGEDPDEARRIAGQQYGELFPDHRPAPGQYAYCVLGDDGPIGWLVLGRRGADEGAFWVWDVKIVESERGKGHGRTTMLLAEEAAREAGAKTLGLNVFGRNTVARNLYESLGYSTLAIQMQKEV
jgi:GNAT superfamily N-acetyltransferase